MACPNVAEGAGSKCLWRMNEARGPEVVDRFRRVRLVKH